MKKFLGMVAIAALGGLAAIALYDQIKPSQSESVVKIIERTPVQYAGNSAGPSSGPDFRLAAQKTVNSVVHIETEMVAQATSNPWMEMFGQAQPRTFESSGSGVIISDEGHIVTNNHVVENAEKINVTLNDNRTIEAEVIGADPAFDLALIKIDEKDLPYISFGNSDDVEIGEWVLAVGNPFNLTSTVTAGIVSAKARNINLLAADPNRQIFPVESFIQTDAAVNPGNSGGALVNINGDLIGINTAIASRTGSYSGYSFAVPSSIVQKVTKDLLEYGNVQRAYIGVSIVNLDQETADKLDIDDVSGVLVNGLTPGGAAAEVGIEEGDILLSINEYAINNVAELQEQVSKYRPGDEIKVSVKRDNMSKEYSVIVRDRRGNTEVNVAPPELETSETLGAIFEETTSDELARLGLKSGVKLANDEEGRFRRAGIKEGFIITQIDKKEVSKPSDVSSLLSSMEGGVLIAGVYPNGTVAYYGFGM